MAVTLVALASAPAASQPGGVPLLPGTDDSPGWQTLTTAVADSDVTFVGEWHGFADTSELVQALLSAESWSLYALEVGPEAAATVVSELRHGGVAGWATRLGTAPMSVPFLWWREDAETAARFLSEHPHGRIVGFDREFPWSARLLLSPGPAGPPPRSPVQRPVPPDRTESGTTRDPAGPASPRLDDAIADSLAVLTREARSGYARFAASGDPSSLLLYGDVAGRLTRLAALAEADGSMTGPEVAVRLRALAASARLDAALRAREPDANARRAALMARTLAAEIRRSGGRTLVRTGLVHAARRTGWRGRRELAARLGDEGLSDLRTLHIAVIPAEGRVNGWMPGAPDRELSRAFDGIDASRGLLDLTPWVAGIPDAGWTLYDLRHAHTMTGPDPATDLPPFDFLLIVRRARAATLLN